MPRWPCSRSSPALAAVFKAYDIRGIVPDQLNTDLARAVGAAFAAFAGSDRLLVARDMRPSGVELTSAFAAGVTSTGVDVVDLGLTSTDELYFASGSLDARGRHVHRLAQPGAVQRDQALPGRGPAGRRGHRAPQDIMATVTAIGRDGLSDRAASREP